MAVLEPLMIALNMVLVVWAFRVVDRIDHAESVRGSDGARSSRLEPLEPSPLSESA
jgi:hypothetical protein